MEPFILQRKECHFEKKNIHLRFRSFKEMKITTFLKETNRTRTILDMFSCYLRFINLVLGFFFNHMPLATRLTTHFEVGQRFQITLGYSKTVAVF